MLSCVFCQNVASPSARFCSECGSRLIGGNNREQELTRQIAELTVLRQVGEICASVNTEDELFERVTKSLSDGVLESSCGFMLLDARRSCLLAHSSFVITNANVDRSFIPLDRGTIGEVARTGRVQRIGDVRHWDACWRAVPSTLSELCVPLFVNSDLVGVIKIERPTVNAFSDFDEQLVVAIAQITSDSLARLRARSELRASEDRHRLLMDSLPAYISYVDNEERYRWVNRAYEEWYRLPRAEIIGKSLRDLQGEKQYQQMSPSVREVLSGHSVRYENTFYDPAGKLRIFDTQYVPHHCESGQVVGFFVLVSEVTAERTALKMLGDSELQYRQLFETCGDSIFVLDSSGQILSANPAAARTHGYSQTELLQLNIRDLDDAPSAQHAQRRIQQLLAGENLTFELIHRRKDGTVFPVDVVARPMQRGDQTCILAIDRDITERKRSEERFSKLFFASPFSIIVASYPDGKIVDANEAFLKLFGFRRSEVLGKTTGELDIWVSLEDRAEMLQKLARHGSARDLEIVFRRKSGETITLLMSVEIILLDGNPHALAMSIDISDRIRAEHQSQQLRDKLAHANRVWLLSEISSGLAHELNQPLTAIHLYASSAKLLAEQHAAPDLIDYLNKIGEQSFRAGEIIRRMRSFVRNTDSNRSEIEINTVVRDVLELLTDYVRQTKIATDCAFATGELRACADCVQIQQVIVNLIRNAVEAMRDIKDRPRVLSIKTEVVENEIQVSISDTGCGLDPSIAAKLFFPFQTTKPNGLGLGLSICRTLIEAHGGRINASSQRGFGTTFTFTLPTAP